MRLSVNRNASVVPYKDLLATTHITPGNLYSEFEHNTPKPSLSVARHLIENQSHYQLYDNETNLARFVTEPVTNGQGEKMGDRQARVILIPPVATAGGAWFNSEAL